jgi:hypothetical protein
MMSCAPRYAIDHVGLGISDLETGIAFVSAQTGVTAVEGGSHPGHGTHNALLGLGDGAYLEIIAPVGGAGLDPELKQLATLTRPKPLFFAVRTRDAAGTQEKLRAAGFGTTPLEAGSRVLPGGQKLRWKTFDLTGFSSAAPFFIEWDPAAPHPSTTSPEGCRLSSLELTHPDSARLEQLFAVLGLQVRVHQGEPEELKLKLRCGLRNIEL